MTLIILWPYKFDQFYFERLQLEILKKNLDLKYEVHDLSKITNPNFRHIFKNEVKENVKEFQTIAEWKDYFYKIINKEKIVVYNNLETNTFKSVIFHYILVKSQVKIIYFKSPGVPDTQLEKINKINFKSIIGKLKRVIYNLSLLIFFIKNKFFLKLCSLFKYKEIIVLYSGKIKNFDLKSKKTTFVKVHSWDYSRFLTKSRKKPDVKPSENTAVFLDGPGPYLESDFEMMGLKNRYNLKKWYSDLNNFFHKIENFFSLKVIIVPHPRSKNVFNPYYDKIFKINHEIDAANQLIPNSKFAMSIAGSTAISFAVASYKPIVFICNDQLKKFNETSIRDMEYISKILNSNFININSKFDKNFFLKPVNKNLYDEYKFNYLTSKEISNKMNYQIFKEILN